MANGREPSPIRVTGAPLRAPGPRPSTVPTVNPDEYLSQRVDYMLHWYDQKSGSNQRWYKRMTISQMVIAALMPFLAAYTDKSFWLKVMVGAMGALIGILSGAVNMLKFQEKWIEYRAACEALRKEKFLFVTRVAPYAGDDAFAVLVSRVEELIGKETTNWTQYTRNPALDVEKK